MFLYFSQSFFFSDLCLQLFLSSLLIFLKSRENFLLFLVAIEMLILSINLSFIYWSLVFDDLFGLIFSVVLLTLAAAETAIGLAIAVSYFRLQGNVTIDLISLLKG